MHSDDSSDAINLPTYDTEIPLEGDQTINKISRLNSKKVAKANKKILATEDYIIDLIASQSLILIKSKVKNPWLCNPFKKTALFSSCEGRLLIHFESNYLRNNLCSGSKNPSCFFAKLELILIQTINNLPTFFTIFFKYKHGESRTFLHSVVCFLIFLSQHLKSKHMIYLCEFMIFFAQKLTEAYENDQEVTKFIIETFLRDQDFQMAFNLERLYNEEMGQWAAVPTMGPRFIIESFVDYLVGNDLLNIS